MEINQTRTKRPRDVSPGDSGHSSAKDDHAKRDRKVLPKKGANGPPAIEISKKKPILNRSNAPEVSAPPSISKGAGKGPAKPPRPKTLS